MEIIEQGGQIIKVVTSVAPVAIPIIVSLLVKWKDSTNEKKK